MFFKKKFLCNKFYLFYISLKYLITFFHSLQGDQKYESDTLRRYRRVTVEIITFMPVVLHPLLTHLFYLLQPLAGYSGMKLSH